MSRRVAVDTPNRACERGCGKAVTLASRLDGGDHNDSAPARNAHQSRTFSAYAAKDIHMQGSRLPAGFGAKDRTSLMPQSANLIAIDTRVIVSDHDYGSDRGTSQ
jgi:hypothetical protein